MSLSGNAAVSGISHLLYQLHGTQLLCGGLWWTVRSDTSWSTPLGHSSVITSKRSQGTREDDANSTSVPPYGQDTSKVDIHVP